jgi:hypothetical protein
MAKRGKLLGYLLTGRLALKKLTSLEKLDLQVVTSVPDSSGEILLSGPLGTRDETVRLDCPSLKIFRGEDVLFEPNQDYYFQRGILGSQSLPKQVRRIHENHRLGSKFLAANFHSLCLIQTRPEKDHIPTGILLCGKFPENWYHWIVNILPKVRLLAYTDAIPLSVPFLVPESVKNSNFEEALMLAAGRNRRFVYLPNRPHEVANAYLIESPVHEIKVVKGTKDPNWSTLGFFHFEEMRRYRESFESNDTVKITPSRRKIFLLRGESRGRPYNEEPLRALLERRGFHAIEPDRMSVEAQIAVFRNAEVIVGLTGAHWVGAMWTTRALCIYLVPKFLTKTSIFPRLGSLGESRFVEFTIEHDSQKWHQYYRSKQPAVVRLEGFTELLDRLEV